MIFKLLSCKYTEVIKTHTEVNNHQRACCDSHNTFGTFPQELSVPLYSCLCSFFLLLFFRGGYYSYLSTQSITHVSRCSKTSPGLCFTASPNRSLFSGPCSHSILYVPPSKIKTKLETLCHNLKYNCVHACEFICNFITH